MLFCDTHWAFRKLYNITGTAFFLSHDNLTDQKLDNQALDSTAFLVSFVSVSLNIKFVFVCKNRNEKCWNYDNYVL